MVQVKYTEDFDHDDLACDLFAIQLYSLSLVTPDFTCLRALALGAGSYRPEAT